MTQITERKPYFRVWGELTHPVSQKSLDFFNELSSDPSVPKDGDKRGVMATPNEFTTEDKAVAEARVAAMTDFTTRSGHTFKFTMEEVVPE